VKSVVHGNRGNNHAGKISEEYKQKVKDFATGKYKGFNDRHMQEKLQENESIQIIKLIQNKDFIHIGKYLV
jgi:hypothetical protein